MHQLVRPFGLLPRVSQSKVETGLLFRPSHCAECIAARKLTRPLSQMVPLTPLTVFGETRAPVSLAFSEEARTSAAHAGTLQDATACRIARLEAQLGTLSDELALSSKLLRSEFLAHTEDFSSVLGWSAISLHVRRAETGPLTTLSHLPSCMSNARQLQRQAYCA